MTAKKAPSWHRTSPATRSRPIIGRRTPTLVYGLTIYGQAAPEQSSLQVEPSGQSVLQRLVPQLTAQVAPAAHFVLQLPPLQLTLHLEPDAHSVSHAPPSH